MGTYKKFKVEAIQNGTKVRVLVKGIFGWKSGWNATEYFNPTYDSDQQAF